jgi:hypothetical protein
MALLKKKCIFEFVAVIRGWRQCICNASSYARLIGIGDICQNRFTFMWYSWTMY